jgi:hypothetical protein
MTTAPKTRAGTTTEDARAVFEAAAGFGLTAEEMLKAVAVAVDRLPTDVKADCIDELAGALGKSLITKQERLNAKTRFG